MSRRSVSALVRLPLWAIAIGPRAVLAVIGWAFLRLELPAVEYRTWPMAVARQAAQALGPEHVGHPAHRLLGMEVDAVGGRDARGLLAAMLERVESEVRDVAGLRMVPDAEQPALVVEPVVLTPCGAQIRSSTRVRSGPARHPRSSWLRAGARAGRPRWSRSTATGWPTPPSEPRTRAPAPAPL